MDWWISDSNNWLLDKSHIEGFLVIPTVIPTANLHHGWRKFWILDSS